MKEIKLTKGYIALVDNRDYGELSRFKWIARVTQGYVYAARNVSILGKNKQKEQKMHRLILGITDPKTKVDHEDHNGLNNQRYNLRAATNSQNSYNRNLNKDNTSGFKGVTWQKSCNKWEAKIGIEGGTKYLGVFVDPLEAACAYDMAAVKHFGEFAQCNFAIPN